MMKKTFKYLVVLISFLFVSLSTVGFVFAQTNVEEVEKDSEVTTKVNEEIQPEYIIFVSKGCPHCAAVEDFVKKYKIEDNITFKEVSDNEENSNLLEQYWDDHEIAEKERGVPTLINLNDSSILISGDTPIMELLSTDLDLDYENSIDTAKNGETEIEKRNTVGDKIFLYLGGVFVLSIIGYGLYSLFMED